jgi:hypothetical protein
MSRRVVKVLGTVYVWRRGEERRYAEAQDQAPDGAEQA